MSTAAQPAPPFASLPASWQDIVRSEVNRVAAASLRGALSVSIADVMGTSPQRHIVHVRWACWWRIRNQLTLPNGDANTLTSIARRWGKDHTTIRHGIRKHAGMMTTPPSAAVDPRQLAYEQDRRDHAERYREFYPNLGLPHVRTPA